MKHTKLLFRLGCVLLLLSLLPVSIFAASPPSQAGERKLEGGQRDFAWPVPGQYNLSSCYLDNRNHRSLDIAAPMGTRVVASYAGKVIDIFTGCEHNWGGNPKNECNHSWGNFVLLEHSYTLKNGTSVTLYSRYAHLTDVSVKVGQTVAKGEKVGTVGSTGRSSGPHLDYDILKGGTTKSYSLDPYINELLELPEELHTTFGKCCQEYVAYVKQLYPRCVHAQYNSQGACTDCGYVYDWKATRDIDAMGNYTVAAETKANSIPYAQADGAALGAGQTVSVNATVVNGLGETWYEVTLQDAKIGYVPKAALTFMGYFDSQIKLSNCTVEDGMTLQQASYRLDGKVSSVYPLRKVEGYLDGKQYASWSGTGGVRELSLRSTALNKKLSFGELEPGQHTLSIFAADSTGRDAVQVFQATFVIEKTVQSFTVTFAGQESTAITVQEGNPLGELPVLSMEEQMFLGWFTENGEAVTAETVPTGDMTLYAKWEQIPQESEPTIPTEPEVEQVPTQPVTAPETEPLTLRQEAPAEEKSTARWLIPAALVILGGGVGVFFWIQKKKSAQELL